MSKRNKRNKARPAPGPASAPAAPSMNNPALAAVEAEIEKQLQPQNRADYMKVVVAGMRSALAGGPNSLLARLRTSKNPVNDAIVGAVNLVLILRQQSRNTMPVQAMIPASETLMLHALDFADRLGLIKVDQNMVAGATKAWANYVFHLFKITPQKMQAMAQQSHSIMNDPTQREMLARKAGVVKDPRASTPTEMPEAANGV